VLGENPLFWLLPIANLDVGVTAPDATKRGLEFSHAIPPPMARPVLLASTTTTSTNATTTTIAAENEPLRKRLQSSDLG
jgi:hypothetical protein